MHYTSLSDGPFRASLITLDEVHIIADPFWDGTTCQASPQLEETLRNTQLMLLSHSTPEFLSGYLILCVQYPHLMENISVYCTLPVNQLGRISTVEYYRSHGWLGPLQQAIVELEDVDEWFDKMNVVKYAQTTLCGDRLHITAYCAGHTLGGSFWLLAQRHERVVYAPAWNHAKDSFLSSAAFMSGGTPLSALLRPTALITGADIGSAMPHRQRVTKFLALVDATLANGGAVVLPTTLSGRFLELFRLVDEHLQGAPIPVYFVSYSGTKILSYASSLLDWMSGIVGEWDDDTGDSRSLPFAPSKVDLLPDAHELIQLSGPKIVFCSGAELGAGDLSSAAFRTVCQDEKTTVVLTERAHCGLGAQLFEEWQELAEKRGGAEDGVAVPLEKVSRVETVREEPIKGNELAEFKERVNNERREKMLRKARDSRNRDLLEDDSSGSEEEKEEEENEPEIEIEEMEIENKNETHETQEMKDDKVEEVKKESFDVTSTSEALLSTHIKNCLSKHLALDFVVNPRYKPRHAMFPYAPTSHKRKIDDYGETVDPAAFQKTDQVSNTQIIMEGKKKFEEKERRFGRREMDDSSRLTPQETLNNQVLERNLSTLASPKKRISASSSLRMRCGLSFVDLAGLVDIRSLNMVVSSLRPYHLVVLPGTHEGQLARLFSSEGDSAPLVASDSHFFSLPAIRAELRATRSHAPAKMALHVVSPNDVVRIGTEDSAVLANLEVQLDDELFRGLVWHNIDGSHSVAAVSGRLDGGQRPTLRPAKAVVSGFDPKLAIGNIRLAELRKKLQARNLQADFKSEGTLVVNDCLAVRKVGYGTEGDETGDVVIEGGGSIYYVVRECVREMLAYI